MNEIGSQIDEVRLLLVRLFSVCLSAYLRASGSLPTRVHSCARSNLSILKPVHPQTCPPLNLSTLTPQEKRVIAKMNERQSSLGSASVPDEDMDIGELL